jgi:hypothetical protein
MRMVMWWIGTVMPLTAQALAPGASPAAKELLEQVRQHMVETLRQQPNYTCLETIERFSHAGHEKDFRLDDRLRLEVALVEGKEMFAWPGSKEFEDTDLRTFFSTGMYGTGEFGAFAKGVFGGRSTRFRAEGEQTLGSTVTARYSFRVPVEQGMWIQGPHQKALSGYHGLFFVQRDSLDVLRLEVEADELPDVMDLRQVTDTIEYSRVKIGEGDFLLPATGETVMVSLRGNASRNQVRFSGCHEFTGQSKLSFGDAADTEPGLGVFSVKQEVKLPRNMSLTVRLTSDIDLDKAALGDPVAAVLNSDVKVKGQVVLPKGAAVSGRIVRLERYPNFTVVGLMFQEAESDKAHAALDLSFDQPTGPDVLSRGIPWGTRSAIRPHEGLVPLRAGKMRGRGTVLLWRT